MKYLHRHTDFMRFAAISMLMVFFTAILPHDLIHDLASHKDTVDVYGHGITVSNHHIHCDFLRFTITPYVAGQATPVLAIKTGYASFAAQLPLFLPVKTVLFSDLRAPPLID